MRPVLVGVDGGADALLEAGYRPDVVIGDFDSVSDDALASGAHLIVHAYPGGHAPGAERLEQAGRRYSLFEAAGTSEDIALILAGRRVCNGVSPWMRDAEPGSRRARVRVAEGRRQACRARAACVRRKRAR